MTVVNRRAALGLGAAFGLSGAVASAAHAQPHGTNLASDALTVTGHHAGTTPQGAEHLPEVYDSVKRVAGGVWHSRVATIGPDLALTEVIDDTADIVIKGASVQKLAVACAVLDRVDKGVLSLGQKIELDPDFVIEGSGIYFHQGVYHDQLTLANILTAMLLVSDNSAVRACASLVPGVDINAYLAAAGFEKTRVEPRPGHPNRFYLGVTTAREMTTLLTTLALGKLLGKETTRFMLGIMRGLSGYHDGIRHVMSSGDRDRIATKYGALDDKRHEAGIMFTRDAKPALVYGFFTEGFTGEHLANYGSTHPAVAGHAMLGRAALDAVTEPDTRPQSARKVADRRPEWPITPSSQLFTDAG